MKKLFYFGSMKRLFAILMVSVLAASCFKYEDGPFISFRSKKARLTGVWKLELYTQGDTEVEAVGSNKVEYKKDGTLEYRVQADGEFYEKAGTWEWLDKKNMILEKANEDDTFKGYEILRLANNELWYKQQVSKDDHVIFKFKKVIEQ